MPSYDHIENLYTVWCLHVRSLLVLFLFLVTRLHEIFIAAPNFHYDDVRRIISHAQTANLHVIKS